MPDWNFFYLFGLKDETSECYTVLDFSDMKVHLFLQEKTEEEIIFEGGLTLEDDPQSVGVSSIRPIHELKNYVIERHAQIVYVMKGIIANEVSNFASFEWLDDFPNLNTRHLYAAISKQRAIKNPEEML